MNEKTLISRMIRALVMTALAASIGASVSCMTAYDSAGRPVQAVDPGVAVAAAAAAGVAGYAIADGNNYRRGYYGSGYYGGGYYRPYYYGGGHHHGGRYYRR